MSSVALNPWSTTGARVFVDPTSQFSDHPGVRVGVGSSDIGLMVLVIGLPGRIQFREMSPEVLNCAVDSDGLTSGYWRDLLLDIDDFVACFYQACCA